MKKILIAILIVATHAPAFAQSQTISQENTTLKNTVDTGITNKNAVNKVRAATEGAIMKKVVDYALKVYDSTKASLETKLDKTDRTIFATTYSRDTLSTNIRNWVREFIASDGTDIQTIAFGSPYSSTVQVPISAKVTIVKVTNIMFGPSTIASAPGNNVGDLLYYIIEGSGSQNYSVIYGAPFAPFEGRYKGPVSFQPQAVSLVANSTSLWVWDGAYWNLVSHSENYN